MTSTADTWVPQAATEPPIPSLSLPVHRASALLWGDRREGAEGAPGTGRTVSSPEGAKGTVSCERRKRKSRRAGRRGIAYAAYGAFDGGVMRWV